MSTTNLTQPADRLPPTTDALLDDTARPYFLWWTDATVGQLKEYLTSSDLEERAYWMGALLREANTRTSGSSLLRTRSARSGHA
jgi:hypothetical protein